MNRHLDHTQIVWGHKTPQAEHHIDSIVPWVRAADRQFYDIFLRGNDVDDVLRRWIGRRSSEISLRRTRLLICDDRIAGGYVAIAGAELAGCRQADLLALAREMGNGSYSDLRARMDDLSDLFASVEEHDFYLSKLGVLPDFEGRGLRSHLMDDCLRRAQQGGFGRVRVDVAEGDEVNLGFFEGYQFRPIYRGKTKATDLRYLSLARST